MRIGILGGSFNPAHQGHIHISKLAIRKLRLNQIWWIPTTQNPFKSQDSYLPILEREKLCQNLITNHRMARKIRLKNFPYIYSINLVKRLKKSFPNHHFIWLGGSDILKNLHQWRQFKNFAKLIEMAIFARQIDPKSTKKRQSFQIYRKLCNFSSQKISQEIYKNKAKSSAKTRNSATSQILNKKIPKISLFSTPILSISSSEIRAKFKLN